MGFFRVPPNCIFEVDDYEADWIYARPFDFIHGRELAGFVAYYGQLFSQAFKHLKSGGYLEMQTIHPVAFSDDGTLEKAKNMTSFREMLIKSSEQFGKDITAAVTWKEEMVKAGFTDVKWETQKVC
jgi:hypothetical protein